MREIEALKAIEFRFTAEDDQEKYGKDWYRYSEEDLIRMPARDLVVLEADLNMPIVDVMNGMRMSTVLGDTGAAWLGVRARDVDLAGNFADFNPLTMLIEWRKSQDPRDVQGEVAEGKAPESPRPPDDGSPAVARPAETSASTATVALPNMPAAE